MLIAVHVKNPGEGYPQYRVADVEAPDPYVIGQHRDTRVVVSYASYANYADYDQDPPFLDTMVPDLVVERLVGTDALGTEAWKKVGSEGSDVCIALNAVARMLYARTNPINPATFHIIEREPDPAPTAQIGGR